MKALVTGASGHLGANVVRVLLREGYQVRCFVRPTSNLQGLVGLEVELRRGDVRDAEAVKRALGGCHVAYHLAAINTTWWEGSEAVLQTALKGTANLLEGAAAVGSIEKIVYTSSVVAVGMASSPEEPLDESSFTTDFAASPYVEAKTRAELLARERAERRGLPLVIVNPATVLGAWDYRPTPSNSLIVRFLNGEIPGYLETGTNIVDAEDVAWGHLLAERRGQPGQRYILGGANLRLGELLSTLAEITGLPRPRVKLSSGLVPLAALGMEVLARLRGRRPLASRRQVQRVASRYAFYRLERAQRELGYTWRDHRQTLARAVAWFLGTELVASHRKSRINRDLLEAALQGKEER